ncbi:hypothetical protein AOA12_11000 [Microbacterium sp. No. 7]|nr:hypothetical protein AOA12_11000 [Microbacterium sp. No. 7]
MDAPTTMPTRVRVSSRNSTGIGAPAASCADTGSRFIPTPPGRIPPATGDGRRRRETEGADAAARRRARSAHSRRSGRPS